MMKRYFDIYRACLLPLVDTKHSREPKTNTSKYELIKKVT